MRECRRFTMSAFWPSSSIPKLGAPFYQPGWMRGYGSAVMPYLMLHFMCLTPSNLGSTASASGRSGSRTRLPAIQLAIEGRQSDGWYDLGEIQIE